MAGLFITFEGIDRSGKTTQAERLAERLRAEERSVVFTLEPGGTELGRKVRGLLLERRTEVDPSAEMLLFAADRAQHVNTVIRPALLQGNVVVSDRFFDSTVVYQGYGRGLDLDRIQAVQEVASGGLRPDLTVWIDVDLETVKHRWIPEDADRLEAAGDAFFNRVRNGYRRIWQAEPERVLRVDGRLPVEDLACRIYNEASERLAASPRPNG
ncbi:MAG: dTMP kinase [Gemmatimonadetes bacterium]|nr:dTMP kinase [Gemmatimonadota bacterium]MDE3257409.1 dTMP kinase [Gemmatimonadota bacterium]